MPPWLMEPVAGLPVWGWAAVGGVLLFFAVATWMSLTGSEPPSDEGEPDQRVNVLALEAGDVPASGPRLELYNVPTRLVLLVIAPLGRGGVDPSNEQLPRVMEDLIPGLMPVLSAHQPVFRRWPRQLSAQGFGPTFFRNVPLPGDGGKGTPWCAVAGKFESGGHSLLVGMVMKAAKDVSFGQIALEREGQWLDVLRVKEAK